MFTNNGAAERARWAVMWIYVKNNKRKKFRKDFGDDLASAEKLYLKAIEAKKPYVTLACVNMGFPPPKELRSYTVTKRGRDKHTRKIRTVTATVNPLKEMNIRGELWCPHCRAVRKFIFMRTASVDGIVMEYPRYVCPLCGVSHKDYNVRKWNYTAAIHMESSIQSNPRATKRSLRRKRRRQRA